MKQVQSNRSVCNSRYLPFDIVQTLSKTFIGICLHDRQYVTHLRSRLLDLETVGENAYFAKLSQK